MPRYMLQWSSGVVTKEDGEVVEIHAELYNVGKEKAKLEHNAAVADGKYRGTTAKVWLGYRADCEVKGQKVVVAVIDKMVDRDLLDPESEIGKAWIEKLTAEARRDSVLEDFWVLKRLADLDDKARGG